MWFNFVFWLELQYLNEAGWSDGGRVIACTQPRRLAVQVLCSSSQVALFELFCTPIIDFYGDVHRLGQVIAFVVNSFAFCAVGNTSLSVVDANQLSW